MHEVPYRRYEQLKLRPEGFVEFLTNRVGFALLEEMQPEVLAAARGADEGEPRGGAARAAKQHQGTVDADAGRGGGETSSAAAAGGGDGSVRHGAAGGGKDQGKQQQQAEGLEKGKIKGFDRPIYVLQKPLAKASL
jgi:hypothetical protein